MGPEPGVQLISKREIICCVEDEVRVYIRFECWFRQHRCASKQLVAFVRDFRVNARESIHWRSPDHRGDG